MRVTDLDIDDNASVWAATATPLEPLPPLVGDQTADLVIVGGGFTGVSTAYEVSRRFPDRRVVLVEARRLGNGASGRNGGMALNWINGIEVKDAERAQRVYGVTNGAIDAIERMIGDNGLSVRFRRDGCLEACTDARRSEEAHKQAERLASFGLPIRYLTGADLDARLRAQGVVGATLDPGAGQLHGLDLINGLRGVLLARGVAIYENTPVLSIDEGPTIKVATPNGTITAKAMVLATNGYSPRLGYFKWGVFPLQSHVFATERLPMDRWRELGWGEGAGFSDDLDRIAFASMTTDGELVFGGGSNQAYAYQYGNRTSYVGSPDAAFQAVRATFLRYFPGAKDVKIAHKWTGPLAITLSRMCSMGVQGEHKNVYYALGYSGHGVVLANLAGRVLCDLYSGEHDAWKDLPFYQKRLTGLPPEPLRWAGYHVFTAITGKSPRRTEA